MKTINKIAIVVIVIQVVMLLIGLLIYNKHSIYPESSKNEKFKIAIIIHGYAPRSFKYTYKSIQENIINTLNTKHEVNVYHYSLLSKNNKIASSRKEEFDITIDNNDVNLLKCDKIETQFQEDLDLYDNITCTHYKDKNMKLNFIRSLHGELECIKRFPICKYDMCVMLSSDSLILKSIDEQEIIDSYESNCLYTTNFNRSGGMANGFYIAPPNILHKICRRYHDFHNWCSKNNDKNAEKFLKAVVIANDIENKHSNMYYLKIRATGKSNWYINLMDNYNIKNKDNIKKKFK
tara:strand:- start:864 stop:1739 length:876 start_codon:yes stop_codon:yes gene_type:complete